MPISKRKPRKQQKLFGMALGMKRGKVSKSYSPQAAKIASTMSEDKIRNMVKEIGSSRKRKRA